MSAKTVDRYGVWHSIVIEHQTDVLPKCYSIFDIPPPYQEYEPGLTHTRYWIDGNEVTATQFKDLFPDLAEKLEKV
jgi:hypothetical protein